MKVTKWDMCGAETNTIGGFDRFEVFTVTRKHWILTSQFCSTLDLCDNCKSKFKELALKKAGEKNERT